MSKRLLLEADHARAGLPRFLSCGQGTPRSYIIASVETRNSMYLGKEVHAGEGFIWPWQPNEHCQELHGGCIELQEQGKVR